MAPKHNVTTIRTVPSEFPEVVVVMSSGREWRFRRTICARRGYAGKVPTDHFMGGVGGSVRPTYDFSGEYRAAKKAAEVALDNLKKLGRLP